MSETAETKTTDPDILLTPSGTVDLRTGKWSPAEHPQEALRTSVDPADDPFACRRWLAFLAEISENNPAKADYIGRFMGYSLSGHTSEQVMLSLYGRMNTGKSTLLNIWEHIMGDYASQVGGQSLFGRSDPFVLGTLAGKRFVHVADEPIMWDAGSSASAKILISGDEVAADRKYRPTFTYRPQFKIAMSHNEPLKFRDDAAMMLRRIRSVQLTFSPSIPDQNLSDALRFEAPNILQWMIGKHLQWRETGLGTNVPVADGSASVAELAAA